MPRSRTNKRAEGGGDLRRPYVILIYYSSGLARMILKPPFDAFAFGRRIFVVKDQMSAEDLAHETCHCLQYRRYTIPGFLLFYAWESFWYGYMLNRLEREAREAEELEHRSRDGRNRGYLDQHAIIDNIAWEVRS